MPLEIAKEMAEAMAEKMAMAELSVFNTLAQIKQELIALSQLAERDTQAQVAERYDAQLMQLKKTHRQRKRQRKCDRAHYQSTLVGDALAIALGDLIKESQQDSAERRYLKQARDQALEPLLSVVAQADRQIQVLKLKYEALSKAWQAEMQAAYLSSGAITPVPIVFQDNYLIVVDKPAGLLSVPGRRYHLQDSVLSRLRCQLTEQPFLQTVHRLDRDTSGLLAIATCANTHKALSQQFARRQVRKRYEAVLSGPVTRDNGILELPLWGDPEERPRQRVDLQKGKRSQTGFRLLRSGQQPRVELIPYTGRTHQLRVHAAHSDGLNAPILGDRLYGQENSKERLCLHATALEFVHPVTAEVLTFSSAAPF